MSRQITLTGVDGTVWDLTAGPVVFAGASPRLWGTVPVSVNERVAPLIPGSFVSNVRHGARDLVVPLTIDADTEVEVEEAINALARSVDPTLGTVAVLVERPDGTQRQIVGRYMAGLDLLALDWCEASSVKAVLAIRCHEEPYWTDPAGDEITVIPPPPVFSSGTTPTDDADTDTDEAIPVDGFVVGVAFNADIPFNAVMPFSGEAGGVVITTIDNQGDVDAWPVFTITGPASSIQATNITTGRFCSWDGTLDAGKVLTVDTRPGRRAVTVDGTNRFGTLEDGSELFPFEPGSQTVAFRFDGATDGVSSYEVAWTDRFLTC